MLDTSKAKTDPPNKNVLIFMVQLSKEEYKKLGCSQPRLRRRKVEISSHYDGCWPGLAWCRGESTLALRTEDKIGRRVKVTLFKPRLEN